MYNLLVNDSSPTRIAAVQGAFRVGRRKWSERGDSHKEIGFNPTDLCIGRLAQARGIFRDYVQHRLDVSRRAGNYTQNLTRRSLMLQGLTQFSVALLDLLEQANILNSDDGLGSEGFKQLDLLFREGTDLHSANANHPNGDTLAHKRSFKIRAKTNLLLVSPHFWIFGVDLCCEVVNVNRPSFDNGSAADKTTANGTTL